jgi:hypothetical protein
MSDNAIHSKIIMIDDKIYCMCKIKMNDEWLLMIRFIVCVKLLWLMIDDWWHDLLYV